MKKLKTFIQPSYTKDTPATLLVCGKLGDYEFAVIDHGNYPGVYIDYKLQGVSSIDEFKKMNEFRDVVRHHGGPSFFGKLFEDDDAIYVGWTYDKVCDYNAANVDDELNNDRCRWTTEELMREVITLIDVV